MSDVSSTRISDSNGSTLTSPAPAGRDDEPLEPDAPRLGDALRRHWLVVGSCVVALAALGVAAALARDASWTASTNLMVGQNNLAVQSIPGFAVGGQAVADGLSRAVTAPGVVDPVARRLGLPQDYVAERVASTPVTRTSVLTVMGTGKDEREAVALANAAAASLAAYSEETQSDPRGRRLLATRYERAYRRQVQAQQRLTRLQEADASDGAVASARAEVEFLRLDARSTRDAIEAKDAQRAQGAVVNPLTPARAAYSDRSSKLQLYGALGVVAGGLIGVALAVLLERRAMRRRRPAVA